MFVDNNWYGHRNILANYCQVKDKPILGSIQHGVHVADLKENLGKHKLPFARHYCWSRPVYENSIYHKINNVIPIGAPFLYLDKMNNEVFSNKGTLTFPAHSNPDDPRFFKHEVFIKYIMDNYPEPYTACLFFLDFTEDIINKYKKNNWDVVTAGNRSSHNFLQNLYSYIKRHECCVSTELGTSLFYSLYLKKKSTYLYKYKLNNKYEYFSEFSKQKIFMDQFIEYKNENKFLLESNIDLERGKKLADIELGM
tara:strand:- start:30 stop:788 length:759 start_codon:yes stop_codon:yes gene_type:complete